MQTIDPAADFKALPLEMLIATPLMATVKAQKLAAEATIEYIKGFFKDPQGQNGPLEPMTLDLQTTVQSLPAAAPGAPAPVAPAETKVTVKAPLLAMVPVPHLRIDSLTVNFKYEVTQTIREVDSMSASVDLKAKTGQAISPWVEASLCGSLTSSNQQENTVNRSGLLDITVRASEAPMPAGLNSLLAFLSKALPGQ